MKTEFEKRAILIDDIIQNYTDLDEYKKVARTYLNDDFFEELPIFIAQNDYEMAKDALKGLYILALELRMIRLYQELLEIYECLIDEEYKNLDDNVKKVMEIRTDLLEFFNV